MIFYKGVLKTDLRANYVPGTITTSFKEALMWAERISSNKVKGAARNVRHGKSVVIKIFIDDSMLKGHEYFQESGIAEHHRENCWTSAGKTKAQVNTPCDFVILTDTEINNLFTY